MAGDVASEPLGERKTGDDQVAPLFEDDCAEIRCSPPAVAAPS
jgi:hypothetical protein